jgi:hypothetical protein
MAPKQMPTREGSSPYPLSVNLPYPAISGIVQGSLLDLSFAADSANRASPNVHKSATHAPAKPSKAKG